MNQKLNLIQAAARTGINHETLVKWCRKGRIPSDKELADGRIRRLLDEETVAALTPPEGYVGLTEAVNKSHYTQQGIITIAARGQIRTWSIHDNKKYYHLQDLIDWSHRDIHHDNDAAPQHRDAAHRF